MTGPYKRKKYHFGDTHLKKGWRVKRKTKDLDEVTVDKFWFQKMLNMNVRRVLVYDLRLCLFVELV